MSTNIIKWTTIKIENFALPLDFEKRRIEWERNNKVSIRMSEGDGIDGTAVGDTIHVDSIQFYGEGSQWAINEVTKRSEQSAGLLDVMIIWEDGDINRVTINNGQLKWEDIDPVFLVTGTKIEQDEDG